MQYFIYISLCFFFLIAQPFFFNFARHFCAPCKFIKISINNFAFNEFNFNNLTIIILSLIKRTIKQLETIKYERICMPKECFARSIKLVLSFNLFDLKFV